jgi:hypothetical protein
VKRTFTLEDKDICFLMEAIRNYDSGKTQSDKLYKKFAGSLKTIKVASRKAKGRNLQYEVCEKIAETFYISYEQSDDSCLIHSREMGQHGLDIVLRGEAAERFPFSIECKNSESFNFVETIEQVKANIKKDTHWLIVHKRKTIPNLIAILDFEVLLGLYTHRER